MSSMPAEFYICVMLSIILWIEYSHFYYLLLQLQAVVKAN